MVKGQDCQSDAAVTINLESDDKSINSIQDESTMQFQSSSKQSTQQRILFNQESICTSKDASSIATSKNSASLYFHQVCEDLPPLSIQNNNNINNNNNNTNCWNKSTDSELSTSLEVNLPGNQIHSPGSTGNRKQSLTVPEEHKYHSHSHSHSQHHRSHHSHLGLQHSHQHHYKSYPSNLQQSNQQSTAHHSLFPSQQSPQHYFDKPMGHQQLEHRSDEGTIEETASPKCKHEPSRSPSPSSTPSPSGSTSFQFFSRPIDDQSAGSSCSSSGVELEFSRKCTVSADSLLLHPDITGSGSGRGGGLGSASGISTGSMTGQASGILTGSPGRSDEAKPMSSDSSLEAGKGFKSGLLLDPGSLVKRKISGSLSSDQIHKHLMFSDKDTLTTPGTRSVSPKMIFSGKYRKDSKPVDIPSTSLFITSPSTSSSSPTATPASSSVQGAAGTSPSRPGSSATSSSGKRKASVANVVLSGPGRLARLLRRTHSAGCSKDVPSHALFLREKPMKHHQSSSCSAGEGEASEKRRGRKQAPALEDMKQRLRFLRRCHTDSSIQSTNVRPTPEEAQKWAESFQILMRSKYGATLFKAFLAREYSQENIEFWMACEEFKKVRPNKMTSKARKIYDDFVAVKSPKEINLDPNLRNDILLGLTNPEETVFDTAQRKIQGMLEQDAYLRFLQSELYRDLLTPVEPKKIDATKYETSSGKLSPESNL